MAEVVQRENGVGEVLQTSFFSIVKKKKKKNPLPENLSSKRPKIHREATSVFLFVNF